jgi:uncharacterized protein YmfQ (DUF2313 family)
MSGIPAWTDADLATAFQQHLPTGKAWPRDPLSVQAQTIAALAPTFQRLVARAANLLIDGFPSTTVELLPEWQESLGLPDPCAGALPTLAQQQAQVLARFTASGGQSISYFVNFAKALGYDISIAQYAPFRAGASRAGQPDCSQEWAFAWRVNAPAVSIFYFSAGTGSAGEPLASWGNLVLQCEIERLSPAHTKVIFGYSDFSTDFTSAFI